MAVCAAVTVIAACVLPMGKGQAKESNTDKPTIAQGGVGGDRGLLEKIISLHENNLKAMTTWRGRAIWHRRSDGPLKDFLGRVVLHTEFAYDRPEEALRWQRTPVSRFILREGEANELRDDFGVIACLVRDGRFYEYRPLGSRSRDSSRMLITLGAALGRPPKGGHYFDPLHYLLTDGDTKICERLTAILRRADNPKGYKWTWTVRKQGDLVTISCVFGAKRGMETRCVFDLSKGGMLREYGQTGPSLLITGRYDFEHKNGVWVPKRYEYTNIGTGEHPYEFSEEVTWMENRVNEPLEADDFTLERLGLQVGDDVQDEVNHKLYKYDGDESAVVTGIGLPPGLDLPGAER